MNPSRPEPSDEPTWLRPAVSRRSSAAPPPVPDPREPLGPLSVGGHPSAPPTPAVTHDDPPEIDRGPAIPHPTEEVEPGDFGWLEPAGESQREPEGDGEEALPWLAPPETDVSPVLPQDGISIPEGPESTSSETESSAPLDPIPVEWWETEAESLEASVPWVRTGEGPEVTGFAWDDDPEPFELTPESTEREPLLDEELLAIPEWEPGSGPEEETRAAAAGWEGDIEQNEGPGEATASEPLQGPPIDAESAGWASSDAGQDFDFQAAPTPAPLVEKDEERDAWRESLQTPVLEDIARRLERIAGTLRSGKQGDLLSTLDDPLQLLIAGYALGAAERARGSEGSAEPRA